MATPVLRMTFTNDRLRREEQVCSTHSQFQLEIFFSQGGGYASNKKEVNLQREKEKKIKSTEQTKSHAVYCKTSAEDV